METRRAGCLCGAVQAVARGAPLRVGLCHCGDCRRHHGALFHASAIFPRTAVAVSGRTQAFRGRHFCPVCGSSVFSVTGDEVELNLGSLDSTEGLRPAYELWTIRREAWLPPFPGLTGFARDRDDAG